MMRKLSLFLSTLLSLSACSMDRDYLNCLYSYLASREFKINGAFYQYDFNHDGILQRNDWIYVDLESQGIYRLLGRAPSPEDPFGWQPLTQVPQDLDSDKIAGFFIYINYPQDPQPQFSWLYLPLADQFLPYKLSGATSRGDFVYLDLDCDGIADPLWELELNSIRSPQGTAVPLPGTEEGSRDYLISFKYDGPSCSQNGGGYQNSPSSTSSSTETSESSVGTSSSSSPSTGPESSLSGGCFYLDRAFTKEVEVAAPATSSLHPQIMMVAGEETSTGYIVGGAVTQDLTNSSHRGRDGFIGKLDSRGDLVWGWALFDGREEKIYDSNEWISIYKGEGRYYGVTPTYPTGSGSYIRSAIVSFNGRGEIYWAREYSMPASERGKGMGRSGYFTIESLIPLRGGDIVAIGGVQALSRDGEGREIYPHTAFAMRLSPDGAVRWAKTFNGSNFYFHYAPDTSAWHFISGVEGEEGTLYITGFNNHTIGKGGHSILVVKMDGDGHILWSRNYNRVDGNFIYNFITTKGGGIAFKDGFLYVAFSDGNYLTPNSIGIMKLDSSGNLIDAQIDGPATHTPRATLRMEGDTLYLGGLEGYQVHVLSSSLALKRALQLSQTFLPTRDGGFLTISIGQLGDLSLINKIKGNGEDCRGNSLEREGEATKVKMELFPTTAPRVQDRSIEFLPLKREPVRRLEVREECFIQGYQVCH
ncbi:MAG: hypothetical protein GXO19_03305 [Epsilonproteobacteria bacterium]|nr:hypothetical protein [Campylobacterota bacterium]